MKTLAVPNSTMLHSWELYGLQSHLEDKGLRHTLETFWNVNAKMIAGRCSNVTQNELVAEDEARL